VQHNQAIVPIDPTRWRLSRARRRESGQTRKKNDGAGLHKPMVPHHCGRAKRRGDHLHQFGYFAAR
jgi:hypothetical protein